MLFIERIIMKNKGKVSFQTLYLISNESSSRWKKKPESNLSHAETCFVFFKCIN